MKEAIEALPYDADDAYCCEEHITRLPASNARRDAEIELTTH